MPYNQLITGRHSSINTSGIQLTTQPYISNDGVRLYFEGAGWVGSSGSVLGADLNHMFPFSSGDSLFLPMRHLDEIYVKAPGSGLTVYFVGQ